MAFTGAVLYARPRAVAALTPGRKTGAVSYVSIRAVSGLFSAESVTASADLRNATPELPQSGAPMGYVMIQGKRHPVYFDRTFWNWLQFTHNTRLGGVQGATLPDVAASVGSTLVQAAAATAEAAGVAQQAQANAEALAVVADVVRNSALPGYQQIPPVKLNREEAL